MQTIVLTNSLDEVSKVLKKYFDEVREYPSSYHPFFRGLSKSSYKLYNKMARPFTDSVPKPLPPEMLPDTEKEVIKKFQEKIEKYNKKDILTSPKDATAHAANWYLLTQMQHLEIPTRMMDWTQKKFLALFFAVCNEKHDGEEGVLWGFPVHQDSFKKVDALLELDPFIESESWLINVEGQMFLYPNYKEKLAELRILKQGGRFFFQNHKESLIALEENDKYKAQLTKFIIPKDTKKSLREALDKSLKESLKGLLTDEEFEKFKEKPFIEFVMERVEPEIKKIEKEIEQEVFGA